MMLTFHCNLLSRATRLLPLGLLALILPVLPVSAMAQSATTVKPVATPAKAESLPVANKRYDATKELARMTKRYGLTEEQRAKIQPLLLEQQRQVHALGEDASLNDSEWNAAVRKVHQKTVSQLKLLLTDAQIGKYEKDEGKLSKQQGDSDDDDHGPPDGPPPGGGPGGPGGGGPPPGM